MWASCLQSLHRSLGCAEVQPRWRRGRYPPSSARPLPGQAALCGPSTAPASVRAPEWMKPPTCALHQRRHVLRKQRDARRRARPRSKDRGPSFHGEPHAPMGPWLAIQSLRPTRAEASQTGNHVPRRERRSPSLHEGELPCLQAKQRELRGPSACYSEGRDAFARRSRRHRDWPRCCVLPRLESAFVGESPGLTARHSPDEADRSRSASHRQRCRFVGDLPTRGVHRLPSGCRCARRPRSPPC